ncbi:MAG: hypothetical protein RIS70_1904 [Planctomycetota bacterium]
MKRALIGLIKVLISCAILGYLFRQAWRDDSFSSLYSQPKDWGLLFGALAASLLSLILCILRWRMLVVALQIPFSIRDAFRLGMLGYLFNFFTLGIVGGDVLKAIMIARDKPGRRLEAVASVLIDRAIGLYALFVLASLAILNIDWSTLGERNPEQLAAVRRICDVTTTAAIVGGIAIFVLLIPQITHSQAVHALTRLPAVGPLISKALMALQLYQRRRGLLLATLLMSLGVHLLSSLSVFLVARGLPGDDPNLATHLVIVPIAMVASAIPLPGGLGAVEYALDFLYRGVATMNIGERQGFIIALAYRVITMIIASIGLFYYLTGRREVRAMLQAAGSSEVDESHGTTELPVA